MTAIVKKVLSVTGSSARKAIVIMRHFVQEMKAGVYSYLV